MKKLVVLCSLLFLLGFFSACGRNGSDIEYPEATVSPYTNDIQNADDPELTPPPPDIPSFDHYEIILQIDPAAREVTNGISRITFTNRTGEPLDTIVLRVFSNAFNEGTQHYFPELGPQIFRHGRDYGYMQFQLITMNDEDIVYDLAGTILSLYPEEPLAPEQTVQLALHYNAIIPMIAHRTGANEQAMWFGMFLPVLAVFGDDGWLTPEYYPAGDSFILAMANFEVEIITPAGYIVAGTGENTGEITIEETDTRVTNFIANNVRDFAFAISPYFQRERISAEGVDIHLYYFTDTLPLNEIINIVNDSMENFSDRIGLYPFDHIRIVETDMFLDSAVFSNMIFMDTAALTRPNPITLSRALGHQWFYNVIGNNTVAEPWLHNGLVEYLVTLFFYEPELKQSVISESYSIVAGRDNLSLTNGLWAFDNWQDYHLTHHTKSMLMFNALHIRMGDELFWELIRQYFQTFYFQIATGGDFKNLAEEIYIESLEDFFNEWFSTVTPLPINTQ